MYIWKWGMQSMDNGCHTCQANSSKVRTKSIIFRLNKPIHSIVRICPGCGKDQNLLLNELFCLLLILQYSWTFFFTATDSIPESTLLPAADSTLEITFLSASDSTPESNLLSDADSTPESTLLSAADTTPESTLLSAADSTPERTLLSAADSSLEINFCLLLILLQKVIFCLLLILLQKVLSCLLLILLQKVLFCLLLILLQKVLFCLLLILQYSRKYFLVCKRWFSFPGYQHYTLSCLSRDIDLVSVIFSPLSPYKTCEKSTVTL